MQKLPAKSDYSLLPNFILEELPRLGLSGREYDIIFLLWRKTLGQNKKKGTLSFAEISNITGMRRQNVWRTLKRLVDLNLVIASDYTKTREYEFNMNVGTWKLVSPVITPNAKMQIKNVLHKLERIANGDLVTAGDYTKTRKHESNMNVKTGKLVSPAITLYPPAVTAKSPNTIANTPNEISTLSGSGLPAPNLLSSNLLSSSTQVPSIQISMQEETLFAELPVVQEPKVRKKLTVEPSSASKLDDAYEVLRYLNDKARHHYPFAPTSVIEILKRLKAGATVEQLKLIIDFKVDEWWNTEWRKHLNNTTLFRDCHYSTYLEEAEQWKEKKENSIDSFFVRPEELEKADSLTKERREQLKKVVYDQELDDE